MIASNCFKSRKYSLDPIYFRESKKDIPSVSSKKYPHHILDAPITVHWIGLEGAGYIKLNSRREVFSFKANPMDANPLSVMPLSI
jgi:hypothetical protein